MTKTVYQKAGNTKETYSFKFACFVGHVSKNRKSERIQHKTSRCFFQTSLGRCAAVPLVLLYKQNTIEPKNKAIIFVPKRTCLLQHDRIKILKCANHRLHALKPHFPPFATTQTAEPRDLKYTNLQLTGVCYRQGSRRRTLACSAVHRAPWRSVESVAQGAPRQACRRAPH